VGKRLIIRLYLHLLCRWLGRGRPPALAVSAIVRRPALIPRLELKAQGASLGRDARLIEGVMQVRLVPQQQSQCLWSLHVDFHLRRRVGWALHTDLHSPELGRVQPNG
jgi:hypothetical protein